MDDKLKKIREEIIEEQRKNHPEELARPEVVREFMGLADKFGDLAEQQKLLQGKPDPSILLATMACRAVVDSLAEESEGLLLMLLMKMDLMRDASKHFIQTIKEKLGINSMTELKDFLEEASKTEGAMERLKEVLKGENIGIGVVDVANGKITTIDGKDVSSSDSEDETPDENPVIPLGFNLKRGVA